MEEYLQDKTELFKPTKELGNLSKYAAEKAFGEYYRFKLGKLLRLDYSTTDLLFEGVWSIKEDYIRILALCLCRIRKRKVQMGELTSTLPERRVMDSLETGVENDLLLYKKVILELCRMPDLPSKTSTSKRIKRRPFEEPRQTTCNKRIKRPPYEEPRQTIYNKRAEFNSDFEYGITDT